DGSWNGITIDRIKDKLGTRELPTAEIHLDGTLATLVGDPDHGVRRIAPMLNVTRCWNAICAVAHMRRCIELACNFAQRRVAFGKPLIEQPLHAATLADMQAQFEAAFHLAFHVASLLGRVESGQASTGDASLLRLLTPLPKLWTGKLAVSIASETIECFGGNGYIEDTGIPQLLRDAQVYPIWEGTTNVLALDALGVIGRSGLQGLTVAINAWLSEADTDAASAIRQSLATAESWLARHANEPAILQAGARQLAVILACATAAALLAQHAAWAKAEEHDTLPGIALARFIRLQPAQPLPDFSDAIALATDQASSNAALHG
ncbi:MAG: acyl-CoA dehydrogenase, partial [Xanthomonadales bacterium]|nr:acyl-CoA dehydrogenase [Xanthomonadales bacterium]